MLIFFGLEYERASSYFHNRPEKGGKERSQRVRKLQLSDVDWT